MDEAEGRGVLIFLFFLIKKEENLSRNPRLTIPQILIGQDWVTPRS